MKSKGFMFTVDALLSVFAIIFLMGIWAFMVQTSDAQELKSLDATAHDKAVTGFYQNQIETDTIGAGDTFGVCNSYYTYDIATEALFEQKFCEKKYCRS